MNLYANKKPVLQIKKNILKISIPFFYGLEASIHQISKITIGTTKLNDIWVSLITTKNEINKLFGTD